MATKRKKRVPEHRVSPWSEVPVTITIGPVGTTTLLEAVGRIGRLFAEDGEEVMAIFRSMQQAAERPPPKPRSKKSR